MLDKLKVKRLLQDPALYISLLPVLACLFPSGAAWFEENKEAFTGLLIVLGLHFGVRIAGTVGAGRAIATGAISHIAPASEIEPGITIDPEDLTDSDLNSVLDKIFNAPTPEAPEATEEA